MSLNLYDEVDPRFARIERVAQRIGWVAIAVLLVLAIAGLFGGGFLSNATARDSANGNEVELTYPRLARQESNLTMSLRVTAPGQSASQLSVLLSGDLLESIVVNGISPQPDTEAVTGGAITYTWTVESWDGPQLIKFDYELTDWRTIGGRMEVNAGEQRLGAVSFEQFLFP